MAKQLRELKGVGEKTEKLFQKIGITTTDNLLHYYPRNYDAYEEPEEIGSLKENTVAAIRATITTGVYVNKIRNLQVRSPSPLQIPPAALPWHGSMPLI